MAIFFRVSLPHQGLDRTYEELKLAPGVLFRPVAPPRLDRTYEELKLDSMSRTTSGEYRLDRTYEELKPIILVAESRRCRKFGSYL